MIKCVIIRFHWNNLTAPIVQVYILESLTWSPAVALDVPSRIPASVVKLFHLHPIRHSFNA